MTRTVPAPTVLLIEGSDFETFPIGGQLTMCRVMMRLFGNRLALVGMNRSGKESGRWTEKEVDGQVFSFYPVCCREPSWKKPLVPARITFLAALQKHRERILQSGCSSAFIQAPEALMAVSRWGLDHICYWFAGVESPLRASRYKFARPLSRLFDTAFFRALEKTELVMAAADEVAVRGLIARSRGQLTPERVVSMPTCVDCQAFRPEPTAKVRAALGLPDKTTIFLQSGRINRLKGWDLLLDSFAEYLRRYGDALLVFAGDGEDRDALIRRAAESRISFKVIITGFLEPSAMKTYLNAADVVVTGSVLEGWSVSMLEALACGKTLVSTQVSGVNDLIVPGKNGFIVSVREPAAFAEAMNAALHLSDAARVSRSIAARYDLPRFGERVSSLWAPLALPDANHR